MNPLRTSLRRLVGDGAAGSAIAVFILAVGLTLSTPRFASYDNFEVLAYGVANLALVAFAQMVVIAAGGMDLSVGALAGLAAVIVGGMMEVWHVPTALAAAAGLALGAAGGAITGWLVVRTGLSAFMVTLATASVFTGINLGLTSGRPFYYLPDDFKTYGSLDVAGVPVLLVFTLLVALALHLLFRNVGLGRQVLALGANPRAAELAGVPTARTRIIVHALSGLLAATAGLMLTARLGVAQPSIGNDWLLNSFAAPIIGGTLLAGGYLSVPGALFGSLLLIIVGNGLIQLGIDTYWTQFFSGLIILAAGGIDRVRALNGERQERAERVALARSRSHRRRAPMTRATATDALLAPPVLELEGISKSFPGVKALDDVGLALRSGEVHALLGENGAGKSTLIRIISGVYRADAGSYRLGGAGIVMRSAQQALKSGIAVVHQERSLVPTFTAAENVLLDRIVGRALSGIDHAAINRDAAIYMERVGLTIAPVARIETLSPAQKQLIEIARALSLDTRILLLDEPTASISLAEADALLETIRGLRRQGVAILYVSHKLEEVFAVADVVSVLRDGRNAAPTMPLAMLDPGRLIGLMIGRSHDASALPPRHTARDKAVLEVRDLWAARAPVPSSMHLGKGEILGWYGLVGSGRTELARVIIGADPARGGSMAVNGRTVSVAGPRDALHRHRIGYVSESRQEEGLFLTHSITANIAATVWDRLRNRFGLIDRKAEAGLAERFRAALGIRMVSPAQTAGNLSGGNQQKVSVAKWLAFEPQVLIFDEPTVGIDVATKFQLHGLIHDLAESGVSIILISSDMPEIVRVADRILVFRANRIVGEFGNDHDYAAMSPRIMGAIVGAVPVEAGEGARG